MKTIYPTSPRSSFKEWFARLKNRRIRVYIAGAISGLPIKEARERFKEAETIIEDAGYSVVNPLELPHKHDGVYESFLKEDLIEMLQCDVICVLPDSNDSKGVQLELHVAKAVNIPTFKLMEMHYFGDVHRLIQLTLHKSK